MNLSDDEVKAALRSPPPRKLELPALEPFIIGCAFAAFLFFQSWPGVAVFALAVLYALARATIRALRIRSALKVRVARLEKKLRERAPIDETVTKLVASHNSMATDLTELKQRAAPVITEWQAARAFGPRK